MPQNAVLWDIGSNIGLYSLYAALNISFVVAFEPMLENLVELKRNIIKNPAILFNKKLHTINLHFDMFHIHNGLIKAASVMPKKDRSEFLNYINTETKFFPFNLLILKKDKFNLMCNDIFKWIFKCEKFFNLKNFPFQVATTS